MKCGLSLCVSMGFIVFDAQCADPISRNQSSPYPPSSVVRSLEWHWDTYKTAAPGSDLWPVTWGPDDKLYAAWGDGGGFGGTDSEGRVSLGIAQIEGNPPNVHGVNVNGGKNALHLSSFPKKGKTDGLLYVKDSLYATINMQDGKWPNVTHVLAWSEDAGATWTKADWSFPRGKSKFEPAKFVNFGKDYSGVPAYLAGYIYLVGPASDDTKTGRGKSLYFARVPLGRIRERDSLEFFAGSNRDGSPQWLRQFETAQPIFTDPNGVSPGAITYLPKSKRFLLSCFHTGPGQLGVFDAPQPWGPWTTVGYYENWGEMKEAGEGLSCEFPSKWISPDELSLWCVFAVYGDGAKTGIHAHDKFNLVKVTLARP